MIATPSTDRSMLLCDDDLPFRSALGLAFTRRGWSVQLAASGEEALVIAARDPLERAVIDLRMPSMSGLDLLRELLRLQPALRVVVLTGYGSIPTAIEAVKRGAVNYLTKPAEPAEIDAAFDEPAADDEPAHAELTVPSLDRAQWEHIQRVLADTQGNISEAARRLGMHRRSLQRKLQKFPPKR
jgi:two-component system, response regulator RegA